MSSNLDFLKSNVLKNQKEKNSQENLLGEVVKHTGKKMNKLVNSDNAFFPSFYTWIIFSILLFIAIVLS